MSRLDARSPAPLLRDGHTFKAYRSFGDVNLDPDALARLSSDAAPLSLGGGMTVAVPIKGNDAIIGVLAACDRETRDGVGAFEPNEVLLLSLFAKQVAVAVGNARIALGVRAQQAMG